MITQLGIGIATSIFGMALNTFWKRVLDIQMHTYLYLFIYGHTYIDLYIPVYIPIYPYIFEYIPM